MLSHDLLQRIASNDPQASVCAAHDAAECSPRRRCDFAVFCATPPADVPCQTTRLVLRGAYLSKSTAKSLGASGAGILASALALNTRLTCIDLRGNNITSEGIQSLLPPLSALTSLRSLDLSYNGISSADACQVIHALARNAVRSGCAGCSSLLMEGNGFSPDEVVACSKWSLDMRLPVPPAHVVKKGFGDIVVYLSGLRSSGAAVGLGVGELLGPAAARILRVSCFVQSLTLRFRMQPGAHVSAADAASACDARELI